MEVAMVEAVLVSSMDGYSEADGYGNKSKTWRHADEIWSESQVFIKYEAEVSSRVSGGKWGLLILASCLLRPAEIQSWGS